ncbi:hypothetical protein [Aquabacterium sp.]|uniref:hypothetical protein n=1 Tax=Aquabacterium sp. TaxID=1872578 RepID=UPI002E32623B|nr:hypothetical protein [Aquabacterium sp.]HEX5310804.1 hypothetical protein [Aquabacterium sp.]
MTKRYTYIGVIATLAYVVALSLFLSDRFLQLKAMPLNEVGDFLAGVFGPVAFLWLVLGYFQQGIELKQNTRALELQAEELKNSVEQQREMVEVSRQQFQAEIEAMQFERSRIEEAYLPRFVSEGFGGMHRGDGHSQFTATIKNLGAAVTNVSIEFSAPMEKVIPQQLPHWINHHQVRLEFVFEKQRVIDCELRLTYLDGAGRPGSCTFAITADLSGQHPALSAGLARYG